MCASTVLTATSVSSGDSATDSTWQPSGTVNVQAHSKRGIVNILLVPSALAVIACRPARGQRYKKRESYAHKEVRCTRMSCTLGHLHMYTHTHTATNIFSGITHTPDGVASTLCTSAVCALAFDTRAPVLRSYTHTYPS